MVLEEKDSHGGIVGPTGVLLTHMFLCGMLLGYLLVSRMLLEEVLLDGLLIGGILLEPVDQDFERADILVDCGRQNLTQRNESQKIHHSLPAVRHVVRCTTALTRCCEPPSRPGDQNSLSATARRPVNLPKTSQDLRPRHCERGPRPRPFELGQLVS